MNFRSLRMIALACAAFIVPVAANAASFDAVPKACVTASQSGTSGITSATAQTGINANLSVCYSVDLPYGTGNAQAQQFYAATRTLAASSNEDLDLNGSTLKDPLGNSLACVHVHYILVKAAASNGANIVIKPSASNGFTGPFGGTTPSMTIPANSWWAVSNYSAGYTVTPSTGDLINIANSDSGATGTYDIVVICN